MKSDFGGHDNMWHGNVLAYVGNCWTVFSFKGYNDGFFENQCVFRKGYGSDCKTNAGFVSHDNHVFSKSGTEDVCGMPFKAYQAEGHDKGTTIAAWPSNAAVVAMGKKVLGM